MPADIGGAVGEGSLQREDRTSNVQLSTFNFQSGFVELDLLRGGARSKLPAPPPEGDCYAMVFRGDRADRVEVFAWTLRQTLPTIPIPLRARDKDVTLNLDRAVHTAYGRARYDRKLRYTHLLVPPLKPADAIWTAERIRAAGYGDSAR